MKIYKLFINAADFIAYAGTPAIDFVVNPFIAIEKDGHMFSKNAMLHLRSFDLLFSGGVTDNSINITSAALNAVAITHFYLHMSIINNYSSYTTSINGVAVPNGIMAQNDIIESIPFLPTGFTYTAIANLVTSTISLYNGNITKHSIGLPVGNLDWLRSKIRFYLTDEKGNILSLTAGGANNHGGLPSFQLLIYDPEEDD